MSQSLAKILIHVTFSTKERRPLIRDQERDKLHAYVIGILENLKSPSLQMNSVTDHVHILFSLAKTQTLSYVVGELKESSSAWIKTQHAWYRDFYWQGGYAAFSVSESQAETVCRYIRNQPEHHKKVSFQDELRALFERHKVAYDERYVWD
jgi:REP element-mobilizing transposase RayT